MILEVELKDRTYDIVLEQGCLQKAGALCNLNRRVLIVTDTGVPARYARTVAEQCAIPYLYTAKQGEESKSLQVFGDIMQTMVEARFTRGDCVVAVGGGVVGDLAGFAAASYMRGIDFYNIPTTVLAQVDSSIGGKTAINLGGYKNMVGAFWQPGKVLIDLNVLQTLPYRQIANGLAESVKMALTSDAQLFELFESAAATHDAYATLEPYMQTVIERSLRVKKYVVEQDEHESGLRKILNFGHTIGHGIEAYEQSVTNDGGACRAETNDSVTSNGEACHGNACDDRREQGLYHGECVALGMIPLCAPAVRERLIPILRSLGLPTEHAFDATAVMEAIKHDKKSDQTGITVIVVPEVGSFLTKQMTAQELGELLPLIQEKGQDR